jgi:colicin import membrane protein
MVQQNKFSPAFFSSLILHVAVLLLLILNFEFSSRTPVVENSDTKIINAVAIDAPPVPQVAPSLPPPMPKPVKPVETQPQPNQRAIEQQKAQALEKQLQMQQAIALNELRKKRLQEQKAAQAKKLLAQKKQLEKTKLLKQKQLELDMEKELKAQAAKSLQQQLLSEQKRAVGAKTRGEVNKYLALIKQAIEQRWLIPPGVDKSLSSELLIRIAPGGAVLDVQVMKSSGNVALDRSARDAVFKASPLPVPTDSDAFDQFREVVVKVNPKNVLGQGLG